jgi:ferredoxin
MAVKVDADACIGCGVCESIYPDLFEMSGDGKATTKSIGNVDSALAQDAASQCPTSAISIG